MKDLLYLFWIAAVLKFVMKKSYQLHQNIVIAKVDCSLFKISQNSKF